MTATAIVMMIIAMLIIWGGLVLISWFLIKNPSRYGDDEEDYVGPVAPRDT